MWIIQEPKKVALWNKQHFEEKNGECAACLKYLVLIFVEKIYIKCNIWRVAVRPSNIWDARFLKVNGQQFLIRPVPSREYFFLFYTSSSHFKEIPALYRKQTAILLLTLHHMPCSELILNIPALCSSDLEFNSWLKILISVLNYSVVSQSPP
jgi:hypothetical protein